MPCDPLPSLVQLPLHVCDVKADKEGVSYKPFCWADRNVEWVLAASARWACEVDSLVGDPALSLFFSSVNRAVKAGVPRAILYTGLEPGGADPRYCPVICMRALNWAHPGYLISAVVTMGVLGHAPAFRPN